MEINPDILKKNPDIVQTVKRVSSSVFFFFACLLIAPAGISPRGEIPRRYPSNSRVY